MAFVEKPEELIEASPLRVGEGAQGAAYDKLAVESVYAAALENVAVLRLPAVYGWLGLDRRGNWLLQGDPIANPTVTAYIADLSAPRDAGEDGERSTIVHSKLHLHIRANLHTQHAAQSYLSSGRADARA